MKPAAHSAAMMSASNGQSGADYADHGEDDPDHAETSESNPGHGEAIGTLLTGAARGVVGASLEVGHVPIA